MINYSQSKISGLKLKEIIIEYEFTDTEAEKLVGGNLKNKLLGSVISSLKNDIELNFYPLSTKGSIDPPCDDDPPPKDPIKPPLGC